MNQARCPHAHRSRSLVNVAAVLAAAVLAPACSPPEPDQVAQPVTTATCAPTPTSTQTVGSKTYYVFSKSSSLSWNTAKADCAAMGGQLASPTSATENAALLSLISGRRLFLGPYQSSGQSSTSAGWVDITGASLSYSNWSPGEPNDSDGRENGYQNCAAMNVDSGLWDDVSCTNTQSYDYVCEFSAAPSTCATGSTCQIESGASVYSCSCASGTTYSSTIGGCAANTVTISSSSYVDWSDKVPGFTPYVQIKGTGYDSATTVTLGGKSYTPVISGSTSIRIYASLTAGKSYTLVITNSIGASASRTVTGS